MTRMLIAIDPDVCIGVGKCEELEPDAVELGDDGISRVNPGVTLPEDRAEILVKRCPSGAITIVGPAPG